MVRYGADVCCGDFGAGRRSMLGGTKFLSHSFRVYCLFDPSAAISPQCLVHRIIRRDLGATRVD